MGSGIDPKVDYAFKRVFGSPENNGVLKHLLNAVLRGSWPTIETVEVLNPFSLKDAQDDRLVILDIKARDATGAEYIVEMQMVLRGPMAERLVYYSSKAYSQQLTQGDRYDELRPVIVVCFLNAILFPKLDNYHGCYELRERDSHTLLTNHWQIHLIELPKFHQQVEQLSGDIERWTYFLQHGEELDKQTLPLTLAIPEIVQATETLTMISQTELERERYEARLKFQMDHDSGIFYALTQGRLEALRSTLLRQGKIRFREVPPWVVDAVDEMSKVGELERLTDRILEATGWDDLFA